MEWSYQKNRYYALCTHRENVSRIDIELYLFLIFWGRKFKNLIRKIEMTLYALTTFQKLQVIRLILHIDYACGGIIGRKLSTPYICAAPAASSFGPLF